MNNLENLTYIFNLYKDKDSLYKKIETYSTQYYIGIPVRNINKAFNGFVTALNSYSYPSNDVENKRTIITINLIKDSFLRSIPSKAIHIDKKLIKRIQDFIKADKNYTFTYYTLELLQDENNDIIKVVNIITGKFNIPQWYKDQGRKLGLYLASKIIAGIELGKIGKKEIKNFEKVYDYLKDTEFEQHYLSNQLTPENVINIILRSIDKNEDDLNWGLLEESFGTASLITLPTENSAKNDNIGKKESSNIETIIEKRAINLNKEGREAYGKKEYLKAIDKYSGALSLVKDSEINYKVTLLFNRGRAYQENGDLDKAIEDFKQIILLNNKHAKAYQYLGKCYLDKESYVETKESLSKALELDNSLELTKGYLFEVNKEIQSDNNLFLQYSYYSLL